MDTRILRDRQAAAGAAFDRSLAGAPPDCSGAIVGQTTYVSSYPTTASTFYAIVPLDVGGTESEGSAASYAPRTGTIVFALNLGTQVPPVGTNVICEAVGGRWTFRYDG